MGSTALARAEDCFGRVGDEEFARLLVAADIDSAAERAQALRTVIAAIDVREGGASFNISASCGVTSTGLSGHDLDRLMQRADQQACASRQTGRDRVSVRPATGPEAAVG